MNGNSEENKDHVELTEKSAQQWLKSNPPLAAVLRVRG
jgi:hypothetical protein